MKLDVVCSKSSMTSRARADKIYVQEFRSNKFVPEKRLFQMVFNSGYRNKDVSMLGREFHNRTILKKEKCFLYENKD